MTSLALDPCPPMALENMAGKVGGFWQVVDGDSRSTTSQVSVRQTKGTTNCKLVLIGIRNMPCAPLGACCFSLKKIDQFGSSTETHL